MNLNNIIQKTLLVMLGSMLYITTGTCGVIKEGDVTLYDVQKLEKKAKEGKVDKEGKHGLSDDDVKKLQKAVNLDPSLGDLVLKTKKIDDEIKREHKETPIKEEITVPEIKVEKKKEEKKETKEEEKEEEVATVNETIGSIEFLLDKTHETIDELGTVNFPDLTLKNLQTAIVDSIGMNFEYKDLDEAYKPKNNELEGRMKIILGKINRLAAIDTTANKAKLKDAIVAALDDNTPAVDLDGMTVEKAANEIFDKLTAVHNAVENLQLAKQTKPLAEAIVDNLK